MSVFSLNLSVCGIPHLSQLTVAFQDMPGLLVSGAGARWLRSCILLDCWSRRLGGSIAGVSAVAFGAGVCESGFFIGSKPSRAWKITDLLAVNP